MKEKNDLISVIIPVYNTEKYLKECIDSVINQSYNNLEIIIVDDGSTDNSLEICNKYVDIDKRIKVIHKKNGGLSDARNVGIENANGKYITFLDSDDFIENDMYEVLYQDICENNAEIAGCDFYLFDSLSKSKSDTITEEKCIFNPEQALIKMNQLTGFGISACNKIFIKELFDKIQFPVGKLNEDWFVMYRLIDSSKVIVYNPVAKYYYRQRENSITKSENINYTPIEATLEVLNFSKNKYPEAVPSCEYAFVNVNVGMYNYMLINDYNISKRKNILQNIKMHKKNALKFKYIKLYKKFQINILAHLPIVYDIIIKLIIKRRRKKLIK